MARISASAWGERRTWPWAWRGQSISPVKRPRPVSRRPSSLRKSDCPNPYACIGQSLGTRQTRLRFQPIGKKRENLVPCIGGRLLAVPLLVDEILKPVSGAVIAMKLVRDAGVGERGG